MIYNLGFQIPPLTPQTLVSLNHTKHISDIEHSFEYLIRSLQNFISKRRFLLLDIGVLVGVARATRPCPGPDVRVEQPIEANLLVDLCHALKVGLCGTHAAKDNVHLLEGEALGLGQEEPDKGGAEGREHAKEDVGAVGDACWLEETRR